MIAYMEEEICHIYTINIIYKAHSIEIPKMHVVPWTQYREFLSPSGMLLLCRLYKLSKEKNHNSIGKSANLKLPKAAFSFLLLLLHHLNSPFTTHSFFTSLMINSLSPPTTLVLRRTAADS